MTQRLVVFAKPPLPGLAKTRIAAALGDDAAAQVAEALLLDTVDLCERVAAPGAAPVHLIMAYAGGREWFEARLSRRWELVAQSSGNLGERLDCALSSIAPGAQGRTVFLGMDAPHLPDGVIPQAFEALAEDDTVLGPCEDGGYYLIGVRGNWPAGTLAQVRWSTEHALANTREAFAKIGLTWATLPEWYDIDDAEALQRLARDISRMPDGALRHVRRVIAG